MTRESRLLYLTGLTLSLFVIFGYFKAGGIVFPFPINSFIFLVIVGQFTWWHYKKGFAIYAFLFTAVCGVLANPVFWEMVYSIEDLSWFLNYPWIYWFRFLHGLGFVICAIYLINRQKSHFTSLITTAGIIIYAFGFYSAIGLANSEGNYDFIGFGLIALSVLIKPTYKPIHYLWILFFILEFTEFLTFFLA